MAVFTSGKGESEKARELKSGNLAEILFLSNATYLIHTPSYSPSCQDSTDGLSYHEMKNKTHFGRIVEILKSNRVF